MVSAQFLLLLLLGLANVFAAFATNGVTTEAKDAISPAGVQLSTVSDELFAILGGSQCAEQLYYGPNDISTSYSGSYFSTNTLYGAYSHDQWLQIVTSDGVTELFRIYWQFSTKKSLADRFINAPTYGEAVSYRIVDTYGVAGSVGAEYTMAGTWYFSNGAAITASKFAVASSIVGFSSDDGCWGAGSGSLNANAVTSLPSFWGVANIDSSDASQCSKIWVNGALYGTYSSSRTFMYIVGSSLDSSAESVTRRPTESPTVQPTSRSPTLVPSRTPTATPSQSPLNAVPSTGISSNAELFAVVGGSQCAENLYYGPSALTEAGSSDGYSYYMKTNPTEGYTAHTDWLQIVSDGSNELFRIYWTFSVARTLSDRFVSAVNGNGEAVSYRVVDTANVAGYGAGYEFTYTGASWQFSNGAVMTATKFTTTGTTYGFSADDGCWGAGTGTLNANSASLLNFWGVRNRDASDTSECSKIWVNGALYGTYPSSRTFMYIGSGLNSSAESVTRRPTESPTLAPSRIPTLPPSNAPTRVPTTMPTRTPTRTPTRIPTRTPTATPSQSPSMPPSNAPTRVPTTMPTRAPTRTPTRIPTRTPTTIPSQAPPNVLSSTGIPSNAELFAVVGGSECAEYLYYGTSALTAAGSSDGYSYYMKTNPTEGYTAHTDWLQIVSDGSNELFRIYWTFSVARTLSDRFVSAVNGNGEAVSYRVVDTANVAGYGAGYEFTYTGASWRFSDSAGMYATKFTTTGTSYGFSADDGCWGAGTGTLNANSGWLSNFWGTANINSADSMCSNIYVQGSVYAVNANVRSFVYIVPGGTSNPSTAPTARPSTTPTVSPTSFNGPYELFAVVGSGACAENLAYGPATLTETGSSDGYSMYFSTSTSSGQQPHTEWLQIVTTGSSGELFRIYWTFSTAKTLADRFVNAPTYGESVSYRVVDTAGVAGFVGTEYLYSGTWRFSDGAAITASKFTNTYTTTGFSADDGAWGAAPTLINANGYASISNFWGVGNLDNSDSASCNNVYANGVAQYTTSKAFMYISTSSVTAATSLAPARSPTRTPTRSPTRTPTRTPTRLPTIRPSARPSLQPSPRPTTTRAPTARPTVAPTVQVAPVVVVQAYLSLTTPSSLLSVTTMSAAEKRVLLNTTATILQVPLANVQFSGSGGTAYAASSGATVQAASSTLAVDIVYETVDNPSFATSPSSVFTFITQSLSAAVQSGAFTHELQAQASRSQTSSLTAASASGVSTSLVTIQYPPTAAPTSAPKASVSMDWATITAIVVVAVAVVLVALLSYCCWRYVCRCGQSHGANGEGPVAAVVTISGYDLGDVEVQVVSGGEDGGAGSIEMMKMSFEQGGQDPSAPPMYVPEADMVAAAAAPPAAYFTESAVAVPTAAVNYYATTTAHCDV